MINSRLVSIPAGFALALSLLFAPHLPAQDAEGESAAAQQQTRKTPAMRERVYQRLSSAQECAEMEDMECAMSAFVT